MTAWTWYARDRNVAALSGAPTANVVTLPWSANLASFGGQTLPWQAPEYPTLLVLGVGVSLTTGGAVANRRLLLTFTQPNGATTEWMSSGTQAASLTRRWEVGVGFALDTTLANDTFREPMPRGQLLLPGYESGTEGTLAISVFNNQVADVLGVVSLRGVLLYP